MNLIKFLHIYHHLIKHKHQIHFQLILFIYYNLYKIIKNLRHFIINPILN